MILEIVTFHIIPGKEAGFLEVSRPFAEATAKHLGARTVKLARDTTAPSRYVAVILWDSTDDYEAHTKTPERIAWRELVDSTYFTKPLERQFFDNVEEF